MKYIDVMAEEGMRKLCYRLDVVVDREKNSMDINGYKFKKYLDAMGDEYILLEGLKKREGKLYEKEGELKLLFRYMLKKEIEYYISRGITNRMWRDEGNNIKFFYKDKLFEIKREGGEYILNTNKFKKETVAFKDFNEAEKEIFFWYFLESLGKNMARNDIRVWKNKFKESKEYALWRE